MSKRIVRILTVALVLLTLFALPALALTESEVQDKVNQHGKEAVSGNVFVWFLCAISFLKISQKIDSFMSSLGINVGHTGGSMMAEALIATRGLSAAKGFTGGMRGLGGGSKSGGASGAGGIGGMFSGGLAGMVGRKVNTGAVQSATGQSGGGLGGKLFQSSLQKNGSYASNIISSIARGNINQTGSMTGDTASAAMQHYMGYAGMDGGSAREFSNMEIGGGHMTGTESSPDNPGGSQFALYDAGKYTAPEGEHSVVKSIDGNKWYKQYAQDAVKRTPYKDENNKVKYHDEIVKKMPPPPRPKDKR